MDHLFANEGLPIPDPSVQGNTQPTGEEGDPDLEERFGSADADEAKVISVIFVGIILSGHTEHQML